MVKFQGSQDGKTYTDIFTVGETVREGWNYHTIDNANNYLQYRYYRFSGTTKESCRFGEIKFKGVETIRDNNPTYSCPVNVVIGGVEQEKYDQ